MGRKGTKNKHTTNPSKKGKNSAGDLLSDQQQPKRRAQPQRGCRNQKKGMSNKALDDFKMREAVEADGTRFILDIAADGNCLFGSLSDQLYHDHGNCHDVIRSQVCDYLEAHEDEFKVFLVLDDEDEVDEDASDFASYVANMRKDGEWGGNLELVVAARLYQRNITVFAANMAAFTIDHNSDNNGIKKPASGPDMLLSYHDNQHFNSVHNNSSKPKPPPPVLPQPPEATTKKNSNDVGPSVGTNHDDKYNNNDEDVQPDEQEEEEKKSCHEYNSHDASSANEDGNQPLPASDTAKTTTTSNSSTAKAAAAAAVKKNDPCPCDSGLRYKKCCLAREKHTTRIQRLMMMRASSTNHNHNNDNNHNNAARERGGGRGSYEQQSVAMDGDFRVLRI